jgi:hypothetical protein
MKRLLALVLLLAACSSQEKVPEYYQENFSGSSPGPVGLKCVIGEHDYYMASYFIYHTDSLGSEIVYSPVGEYMKPKDYPNWQLRPYINRQKNLYNKTRVYMTEQAMPDTELDCGKVSRIPPGFSRFIITHEKLFEGRFQKYEVIEFG